MKKIFALVIFVSCASNPPQTKESGPASSYILEFEKISVSKDPRELSGAALVDGKLFVVADKMTDPDIFEIQFRSRTFDYKSDLSLNRVEGFTDYLKSRGWLDLEGVARCGTSTYLINEGPRDLLIIENNKLKVESFADHRKSLEEGDVNAGFEGVTVDCANGQLYLAKERDPRRLYQLDLKTMQTQAKANLAPSPRVGENKAHPLYANFHLWWGPDYSDLAFDGGFLYVLERGTYEIAKVDPKTWTIVTRASFFEAQMAPNLGIAELYDTGEPYGLAEGLALSPDKIFIGLDNNRKPLSSRAEKALGISGNGSSIIVFKRPKGF